MNALNMLILASSLAMPQSPSLRSEAERLRLNLGTCIGADYLRDRVDGGQYEAVVAREMTMVEPENDLKPPAIWRGIDKYDFTNPDFLVGAPGKKGWAQAHKLKVRGHVLVYARDDGYTIPGWLLKMEKEITPERAKELLHSYIMTVAGRYKGKIAMWDVVNEAIDDKPNKNPFNLRDSFWFRKLGANFLVLAFKYAHEADPKAELYYNEYGVENGGWKADSMVELAEYVRKGGASITGLGLQYHTILEENVKPGDPHYKLLDKIKDSKFAFMITELDLGVPVVSYAAGDPKHGLVPKDADALSRQADHYADIFKMALSYPNCHGVQMWGITDRHSWIPGYSLTRGAALLFDAEYKPKPAYHSVLKVLSSSNRKVKR